MQTILKIIIIMILTTPIGFLHAYPVNDKVEDFVKMMKNKYNADVPRLYHIINRIEKKPEVIKLMDSQFEAVPWYKYKDSFVKQRKIDNGVKYYLKYKKYLKRAEKLYGVKPEVIVAIIGVETSYGEHPLPYRAVDALATLAFDYPRRSDYFMGQLEHLFLYCTKNRINIFTVKGSYAGAVGIPQFMPENIMKYGADFDSNSKIDLVGSHKDAIGSVGKYLRDHGWKDGKNVAAETDIKGNSYKDLIVGKYYKAYTLRQHGVKLPGWVHSDEQTKLIKFDGGDDDVYWAVHNNFDVIKQYNHSNKYAMAVTLLAYEIRKSLKVTGKY